MKLCIQVVLLAAFVSTISAFGQTLACGSTMTPAACPEDSYQVRYAANLPVLPGPSTSATLGESLINATNTGVNVTAGGVLGYVPGSGNICMNVYVFDPNEEELACCTCPITPNGLVSTSVKSVLLANNSTPENPQAAVVKVLFSSGACADASVPGALTSGGRIWGTTLHQSGTLGSFTYGTETEFSHAGTTLSQGEFNRLTVLCAFIRANQSGFGRCAGCPSSGLGAVSQ